MADIFHEFYVKAPADKVFALFTTPEGLNHWWTLEASGEPKLDTEYRLFFGAEHDWRAKVTRIVPGTEFELLMTKAHEDWKGSRVGVKLSEAKPGVTRVHFYHTGWPQANEHWRFSNTCWAMYLRVLRRNAEFGEIVPFAKRLEV